MKLTTYFCRPDAPGKNRKASRIVGHPEALEDYALNSSGDSLVGHASGYDSLNMEVPILVSPLHGCKARKTLGLQPAYKRQPLGSGDITTDGYCDGQGAYSKYFLQCWLCWHSGELRK